MLNRELRIGNIKINDDSDVFVIAEIGHNHQGSLEKCKELFKLASESGASAVKLQKRDNKNLYTKSFYDSPYEGPTSFGDTYGMHRENLEFGLSEYKELQKLAEELNLIFFATAFDLNSLEFLINLKMPVIKIASGDLKTVPLLRAVANSNIPVILSTGGSTMEDVNRAMKILDPKKTAILQCTAAYPAEAKDMDLNVIKTFRQKFPETVIGLSSHDRGISFPVIASVLGARIIEKHFTFDRSGKGTDHSFSLEPVGMKKMVRDLNLALKALGDGNKKFHESETSGIRKMGKMITYSRNLLAGHIINETDLEFRSPMDGISAAHWDEIIGKKLGKDVKQFDILQMSDITQNLER